MSQYLCYNKDMGSTTIGSYLADRVTSYTVELDGKYISLTKLSVDSGLTISHLSRIFSGRANGSVSTIQRLAELLGMSMNELVNAIPKTNKSLARK